MLSYLKLKINDKKTQHIEFQNGVVKKNGNPSLNYPHKLQYLGLLYDGQEVFLRETGLSKFHYKLRKAIRMRSAHYKKLKIYLYYNIGNDEKQQLLGKYL
mgnify:CR=1 FL=1